MKNILIIVGIVVLLLIAGAWGSRSLSEKNPRMVSMNGLHWHPQLIIYVKGEKQNIPVNIGIGPQYSSLPTFDSSMRMTAMHTHEPDGTIHLEFSGRVMKDDIILGNFFRIWGTDMRQFGANMQMTVNGMTSVEYENYQMHDKDVIELHYE